MYRIDGREELVVIGAYPEKDLSDARKQRVAHGNDLSREKLRDKVRSSI